MVYCHLGGSGIQLKTMIGFLKGKILKKDKDWVILLVDKIGFKVNLSEKDLERIKEGEEVSLYCHTYLHQERLELYGFFSFEQLKIFQILEKISGIGPKIAQKVASICTFEELKKAIQEEDYSLFKDLKGVGKKKIQKIILEVSGELKKIEEKTAQEDKEVIEALLSLGFKRNEIKEALKKLPNNLQTTEEKVKLLLKHFSKK